jgi:hypothetical protein
MLSGGWTEILRGIRGGLSSRARYLSAALPFLLQLEFTAKRYSDIEVFVCWSGFGPLLRSINCKSVGYKDKSVQVSAQPHASIALGVVGIRDSKWAARQVDPAGRSLGGNFRVADQN